MARRIQRSDIQRITREHLIVRVLELGLECMIRFGSKSRDDEQGVGWGVGDGRDGLSILNESKTARRFLEIGSDSNPQRRFCYLDISCAQLQITCHRCGAVFVAREKRKA